MKRTIIILLVAFAAIIAVQDFMSVRKKNQIIAPRNYTVILSIDGFRWDYPNKAATPFLDSISNYGVKAKGLKPIFPTKTFPNHYSMATGLYPENHGIVSNNFFAPDAKGYFSYGKGSGSKENRFYLGEPIWVSAEAQRVKTGTFYWVGSDESIKGYRPTYWKKYDEKINNLQRVDSVVSWLNKPFAQMPHLVMWYMNDTDEVGNNFGPESAEIKTTISLIDSVIGVFMEKIKELPIKDSINFIVVSDHGMGWVDTIKTVYLDEYLKMYWLDTMLVQNPLVQIIPKKGFADSIMQSVSKTMGIKAWRKDDLPERFRIKQSNRTAEIIMVADSGWSILESKKHSNLNKGIHGYDNENHDMLGIFYAIGPDFKRNYDAGMLYNVDIYNMLAKLLEIKPAPNDGKPERIMHVLKVEGKD